MTTRTKGKLLAGLAVAALIALASTECVRLQGNLDSYDQRYSDCMEYHKSFMPRIHALDFQSEAYQSMSRDCERRAASDGPL